MEEDDEIQSYPSPASGSPVSPTTNGRITVTVAAPPPTQPPPQSTLTLALPIQQPKNSSAGGGGGGREDCWSEGATAVLIDAWGERYLELSRGNLKQKHWKEVADIVSSREDYQKTPKTDIQCKNRIDTVKKKYKLEKSKIVAGGAPSKWQFYEKLDRLIGPTAKIPGPPSSAAAPSSQTQKVPLGIPVGLRSSMNQFQPLHHSQPQQHLKNTKVQNEKMQFPKRRRMDSLDSSDSDGDASPASTDSFPPEIYESKKVRIQKDMNPSAGPASTPAKGKTSAGGREKEWGNSVRALTQAILKFGEAYEQAESLKLEQVMEMEKQRMQFAKELELQRMQFFMKTQVEISQLNHGRRVGGNSSNHHSNNNNSGSSH